MVLAGLPFEALDRQNLPFNQDGLVGLIIPIMNPTKCLFKGLQGISAHPGKAFETVLWPPLDKQNPSERPSEAKMGPWGAPSKKKT